MTRTSDYVLEQYNGLIKKGIGWEMSFPHFYIALNTGHADTYIFGRCQSPHETYLYEHTSHIICMQHLLVQGQMTRPHNTASSGRFWPMSGIPAITHRLA